MLDITSIFLNPAGTSAFLILVPFVILYLIRPKPRIEKIPSLMFFLKELQFHGLKITFFMTLLRNILFLLQLLVFLAVATAIAKPYLNVPESIAVEHTVIVIDISASSQTVYQGKTRFDRAMEMAKGYLGKRNTIIAAGKVPEVIIENAKPDDAEAALESMEPKDTPTHIYDALVFAGDILKEKKGKVIVFSDFIDTNVDLDLAVARRMLEASGIIVEFISISSPAKNIGIVDMSLDEDKTVVVVKNFNAEEAKVPLRVMNLKETLTIPARSAETFTFTTPKSPAKIELSINDDLAIDNTAYISVPEDRITKVAFITNNKGKYIGTALGLIEGLSLDTVIPPKALNINHDIIILNNINKKLILPGTIKQIKEKISNGASLIIMAQEDLFQFDLLGMLPVEFLSLEGHRAPISTVDETMLVKDMSFGTATKFFRVKPKQGVSVLASIEDSPVIVLTREGKGKILYYGIFDELSDFKSDLYYPIFWKRILDFMTEKSTLHALNQETGKLITLPRKQAIRTPKSYKTDSSLSLDYTGMYALEDRKLAANLLNEKESDVNKQTRGSGGGLLDAGRKEARLKPIPYDGHAIILGAILIFLELLYVKMRGDF